MKKLNVSLLAIVTVAVLSMPAFAMNQMERGPNGVLQNPSLIDSEGSGAFVTNSLENRSSDEHYGLAPEWNNREAYTQGDRLQNPSLIDSEGSGAFVTNSLENRSSNEHYGLAPQWNNRQGNISDLRMENPTLRGVFENYE